MTENLQNLSNKLTYPTDDDRNTNLHYAAANGNVEEILNELSHGQKIDAENYLGWTPLMMAVRKGQYKAAVTLLDHKADATKKNYFGVSIFLMTVAYGKLELIYLILQHLLHGGVSKLKMESALSPLSLTILFRRNCVLSYLLKQNFNVNIATLRTGITPLMFAAALENVKAQKLLLRKNADPNQKNANGQTANDLVSAKRQKNKPNPCIPTTTSCIQQMVLLTPQPFISVTPPEQPLRLRKSSDVITPPCFFTPHLTPVGYTPQIFFPPNFSPHQFQSPVAMQPYVLQPSHVNYEGIVVPSPKIDFYSPCLNHRIMQNSTFFGYASDDAFFPS